MKLLVHSPSWCMACGILVLKPGTIAAQNLVPNPSFEDYTLCPDNFGEIDRCVDWLNLGFWQSSDYFNSCAILPSCDVPLNFLGNQQAADGSAYSGVITYFASTYGYRELIGAQLSTPLSIGLPVRVCFSASPGGFSAHIDNSARFASNNIGLKFFMEPPLDVNYQATPFPNDAAVHLTSVLNDTSTWVIVSGIYIPDSAYEWVVLGNFFADSLTQVIPLDTIGGGAHWAYAFIDGVSVSTDLMACGVMGIDEMNLEFRVMENPFNNTFRFVLSAAPSEEIIVQLVNSLGMIELERAIDAGSQIIELPTATLSQGVFLLRLIAGNQARSAQRVVHLTP